MVRAGELAPDLVAILERYSLRIDEARADAQQAARAEYDEFRRRAGL